MNSWGFGVCLLSSNLFYNFFNIGWIIERTWMNSLVAQFFSFSLCKLRLKNIAQFRETWEINVKNHEMSFYHNITISKSPKGMLYIHHYYWENLLNLSTKMFILSLCCSYPQDNEDPAFDNIWSRYSKHQYLEILWEITICFKKHLKMKYKKDVNGHLAGLVSTAWDSWPWVWAPHWVARLLKKKKDVNTLYLTGEVFCVDYNWM